LNTTTNLTCPPGTATTNTTITGTVYDQNGVPVNGTVNITVNGTLYPNVPLVNGQYNLPVNMSAAGNFTVDVVYGGSERYVPSNTSGVLAIALMPSVTVVDNGTGVATLPVIINGTLNDVNGVPITGFVNITINGTPYNNVVVTNGVYSLNVTFGSYGNYTIDVVYGGSVTYTDSNSSGWIYVYHMPTNATVNDNGGAASDPILITGTLTDRNGNPLTGTTVNLTINGTNYTNVPVNVTNGQFNLSVVITTMGNYTVYVTYDGNDTYEPSFSRDFDGGRLTVRAMSSNTTTINNIYSIITMNTENNII
jgi:hypothetical protein